ncbi:MAG: exo-beta-N-acetylmuramidase NamZ domain-containing protein [Acidobacteriota bacterium]
MKSLLIVAVLLAFFRTPPAECGPQQRASYQEEVRVAILLYHRFGPVVSDSMTVTTAVFRSHLDYLRTNGFTVIPLRQLVEYYLKKGPPPPAGSVVIVADDGHKSVYTEMLPLMKKYRVPVTLFIYPSAISNAPYAMTWDELREMRKTGLFDIQDAGVRFYTYITTLGYAMEAAAGNGIAFYVLDRPDLLNAMSVQGPVMDKNLRSFTGYFPLPERYGMTVGELAEMQTQARGAERARRSNSWGLMDRRAETRALSE